jgi:RNA polymerase sigma-70 factor (ECF subfamily)
MNEVNQTFPPTPDPRDTLDGTTMLTQLGRADFPTTSWTLVLAAGNQNSPGSQDAITSLCATYWFPLYAFIRKRGNAAPEAQDLVQEFFVRFIARRYFDRADPGKGNFRTFLLTCLKCFLADENDRGNALKRGGGAAPLPFELENAESIYTREPSHNETPERIYERRWARALLDRVYVRLREEFVRHGRLDYFNHLKEHLMGSGDAPYAELSLKLGVTESALKTGIHRLRRRYRDPLREEVAATVADPQSVDAELRFLMSALSAK